MALRITVAPSKVVLQNLLICVILFYAVYYAVLGMGCMTLNGCVMLKAVPLVTYHQQGHPRWTGFSEASRLRQRYDLDVLAPFDFKTNPSWLNTNYKVLLVSTEVTYFVCGFLFVLVVEEWVWDYAISVTILHVAITSTVMLEFPLTSHWWAALGSGLILMIMWRPDFSILFIQRQLYLSRSGRVLKEQLN
ncbi:putative transmembrane protein 244 [Equus asinus]|uniref:putative transmembrane protein 244 n=1 Tax=Equus asinus TaxID=9793 RepID=UPI0038F62D38